MSGCVIPGCLKVEPKLRRGLCNAHYLWAREKGLLEKFPRYERAPKQKSPCVVTGCQRPIHHGTICSMHAERRRKTGAVGPADQLIRRIGNPMCALDGCERKAYGLGFCNLHWQRFKKTGDPGPVGLTRRASGEGSIEMGYRSFAVNGKRRREHQMVWEAANGPVPDGHIIHHKNGDKLDNRLENLELMTRSQHRNHHHERGDLRPRGKAKE